MTEANKKKESEKLRSSLRKEYLVFVDLYLGGANPEEAYVESGLGHPDEPDNKAQANKLLRAPRVRLYMDALKREVSERSAITLEAIDEHLTQMAFVDVCDVMNVGETVFDENGNPITIVSVEDFDNLTAAQRAAIASIEPAKTGGLKVKFVDKVKLLDMLIKRRGGYKEVVEQNVTGNVKVFAMVGDNGRGPK